MYRKRRISAFASEFVFKYKKDLTEEQRELINKVETKCKSQFAYMFYIKGIGGDPTKYPGYMFHKRDCRKGRHWKVFCIGENELEEDWWKK